MIMKKSYNLKSKLEKSDVTKKILFYDQILF